MEKSTQVKQPKVTLIDFSISSSCAITHSRGTGLKIAQDWNSFMHFRIGGKGEKAMF